MATCPNPNLKEWKDLVKSRGEDISYFLWDKHNGNVPQSEYEVAPNEVSYSLKSVNILLSAKAKQVFAKAKNAGWDLNKTLTELQVPKDQRVYIQEVYDNISYINPETNELIEPSIEDLVTSILANNTFSVEINTAKGTKVEKPIGAVYNEEDGWQPEDFEETIIDVDTPTQYYSNLTVPGGTNYTENEVVTPEAKPNIKGHAQFSTDNGIGWFRSDEKDSYTGNPDPDTMTPDEFEKNQKLFIEARKTPTKTRRILEVQSDLFQKGRDKKNLTNKKEQDFIDEAGYDGRETGELTEEDIIKSADNQFLQLLNKKGNWVNFFIQSIVQDSIKKGYEKVVFPTGDTVTKIEKHDAGTLQIRKDLERAKLRLASMNKELEDAYTELTMYTITSGISSVSDFEYSYNEDLNTYTKTNLDTYDETRVTKKEFLENLKTSDEFFEEYGETLSKLEDTKREITHLKDSLDEVGNKAIRTFYDNKVAKTLSKLYNSRQIVDGYGNTWNEVILTEEIASNEILLQAKGTERTASPEETLSKVKIVLDKMGVSMQSLTDYAKGNPAVDVSNANALADLSAGIVAVAEGKEDVALTEEMVHIATAIIEQTNPKLITEMIRKIGGFKIYKDTLAEYRDLKEYQLPNGKPNIRKIKKEAVDKLIAEIIADGDIEAYTEDARSFAMKMLDKILDFFRVSVKKTNIDIFKSTASTIIEGDFEGSVSDLNSNEIFKQAGAAPTFQKQFQDKVQNTLDTLEKIERVEVANPVNSDDSESNNYSEFTDATGKVREVVNGVTDKVKAW